MPPFDIETAARHGTAPVRMLALYLAMATRDGAERLTFNRSRAAGGQGYAVEYCVRGEWFTLDGPPGAVLSKMTRLLGELANSSGERLTVRLGGHEFNVRAELTTEHVTIARPITRWRRFASGTPVLETLAVDRAELQLPLLPELFESANEVLRSNSGADGLVHFEECECT